MNNGKVDRSGVLFTACSYTLWGILPLYWKLLEYVQAEEILAHRVIWSFAFMAGILSVQKQWPQFQQVFKQMSIKPKIIFLLVISSLLISINWYVYIWAVNNDHMIDASLGYYINPLVSVILGVIFLKERLNWLQITSFVLAGVGVLISTIHYGKFPWVAVILALSFGLYGLTKKVTKLNSSIGLTYETLVVTPIAGIYLISIFENKSSAILSFDFITIVLLMGAGIVTAIPLLLFAMGAQRIPLYMVGVLQYIAPTITLIIGVLLYNEPFTIIEILTFAFIWSALFLFTIANTKLIKRQSVKIHKKKSFQL
ncbi:EamA family transporter RarD [Metabacillus arenae]|uniref:EamA family transporter RarD n=1 Tax=Metabacillus arenae TaxID=2771434 RepID=A0A926NJJ8_9BACI|nr:EamA family transporter RarD [Metabacillus arenae]MBD1379026.1 EamA family transporter RarD [Metabacillus arenae]